MAIILGFVPMAAGKQEHRTARVAEWLPLAIILLLSFAIRLPFRDAVLIRDEGELALLGQRILQGALPYADVYNQKTPFSFYFLAAVQAVAGEGLAALRTATVVYGLATTAVVYAIARRIGGIAAAAFSALAFSAMTFNQSGTVHQASTEIFLLLWVAAAVALWTPGAGRSPARLLLAGAAAGMAYQSKQSGLAVLAFLAAERGWRWLRNERATPGAGRAALADVGLAAAGFTLVFAVVTGAFAAAGGLDAYLACTWTNNWAYVGNRWSEPGRLAHLARAAFGDIAGADLGLWILGATGLVGLGRGASRRPGSGLWLLLLGGRR
ncbi:MAG: glycosyltransferase family 39 protein [Myxococcota bacterium]